MSDEDPTKSSLADIAREKARKAASDYDKTVEEIKENYDLLLDLRDHKIEELNEKLANRTHETVKLRLLVVDDAESTSEIMNRYLEGQPVEVVCVAGNQALDHLRCENYDAIMIEATNPIEPNVDGLALCRKLCGSGKGESVIVMSSRPGDKLKNSVAEAGAAFLRKPFRRWQLIELMRNVLLKEQK